MNRAQAIEIVRETFEKPFAKEPFVRFIKDLLNLISSDMEGFAPRTGNLIPDAYVNYIGKYERIAKLTDSEDKRLDILIVHLKRETSIDRARSMQRNFISGYLQGNYGSSSKKDAALVAFVTPDGEDWRFSLVKLDIRLDKDEKGKFKAVDEFTPARRWSFLVGSHEKSHTAQCRLVPILVDDEHDPTLTELEDAFNIEKVTKEFFEKYRDLFIRTKGELDKAVAANPAARSDFKIKGIDTVNLAKKLLGQIIFLYYLQKKGWFGVPRDGAWGDGSKNFLHDLFAKKRDNENFFNDILEHLFYDALRNDRSHDDHYYGRFNCKIPFLNGGLFDPMNNYDWVHTDILLPDSLFSNKNKTKEGDTGDGILDVFDRYNFTVKEDEPFEKEVAIDPELLGKAYEKFNAIRPDNYDEFLKALKSGKKGEESKFNRQYGVYYTPREIVHYMCQQSLINYLYSSVTASEAKQSPFHEEIALAPSGSHNDLLPTKEDIALLIQQGENLREHEARAESNPSRTYKPILSEEIREHASLIDEKLASIKVCDPAVGSGAFPVGMMSEIVRAREVLKTWTKTDRTIYDFKRECIENSLYGVDIDTGAVEIAKLRLWLSLIVDEENIQNIKPLPNLDYKIMQGNSLIEIITPELLVGTSDSERTELVVKLKSTKDELFNLTNPKQKEHNRSEIEMLMVKLFENYRDNQIKILKEKLIGPKSQRHMFEDIKSNKADERKFREIEDEIKEIENRNNPNLTEHFEWHINFSEIFQSCGGFDVMIANPPYVNAWSMQKDEPLSRGAIIKALSGYEILSGHWDLFIAFIAKGHQLLKQYGCLSYIVPNPILREKYATDTRKFLLEEMRLNSILEFNESNVFENVSRRTTILVAEKTKLDQDYEIKIFSNPREGFIYLLNTVQKSSWLRHPKHAFLIKGNDQEDELIRKIEINAPRIGNFFYVNYGAQVSSKQKGGYKKKEVVSNTRRGNGKQFYEGKDVQRWHLQYRELWLDYRVHDMYGPRDSKLFEQSKIVTRKVSDKNHILAATLDDTLRYTDDGVVIVVPYSSVKGTNLQSDFEGYPQIRSDLDIKYVLAHLLSKLEGYYFKKRFATESLQGSTSHTYPASVRALVIKNISAREQQPFIKLVDCILSAKRANPQADISALEREIDQLVYQLYGLTEEEIAIVEGG